MAQSLQTSLRGVEPGGRLRVLSLVPFTPRIDGRHGGSRAVGQLLSHLALRHDVAVLHARWPGEPPVDELLRTRCVLVEEVPDLPSQQSFQARVRRRIRMRHALVRGTPTWAWNRSAVGYADRLESLVREWQPDIVQLEFHVMGQFLPAIASTPARRVLVQHEPGIAAAEENGRHAMGALLRRLDLRAWRRFETAVTRDVDAVVVFTERDRRALEPVVVGARLVTIPLGIDIPAEALDPDGADPNDLLFFGSFRHQPNVDAATRSARAIFPEIRSQRPETTLHIVGADLKPEVQSLAGDGVVVLGEVPDPTPHLDRAAVVLVPVRYGGGMRVKVLEALAAGKAVIGSRLAFEGLDLVDGEHALFAESDEEFVAAALDLLSSPSRRVAIASNARAWAAASLSWDSRAVAYDGLYRSLLDPSTSSLAVAGAATV